MTRAIGIALATLVLMASAYADAVFTLGNNPQPNEENVLFNSPMTGTTIKGLTNRSDTPIQFSSTTDTLRASGGQSDIDAMDGLINTSRLRCRGIPSSISFSIHLRLEQPTASWLALS